MKQNLCPSCGIGVLTSIKKRLSYNYKDKTYWVDGVNVSKCNSCEEEIISMKEIKRMEKIARQMAA